MERLIRYFVRNNGHADLALLRREWPIRDDIQSIQKGFQRRRFPASEPRLNRLRRNPQVAGKPHGAAQSAGCCS